MGTYDTPKGGPLSPDIPTYAEDDVRIVVCPDCLGDRGGYVPYDFSRIDGSLIEEWVECTTCGGRGEIEVEVDPAERDDDLEEDRTDG